MRVLRTRAPASVEGGNRGGTSMRKFLQRAKACYFYAKAFNLTAKGLAVLVTIYVIFHPQIVPPFPMQVASQERAN